MENEKQIYDYAYKLIEEENKSSEEIIQLIMEMGVEGKEASNIYYNVFRDVIQKKEEPLNQARQEALTQISKYDFFSSKEADMFRFTPHIFSLFRLYGNTEEWEDGTFITTRWFSLAFLPIFPLGSYRVRCEDEKYNYFGDNTYSVYSKEKFNKKQVIKTYLVWYGSILLLIGGGFFH